MATVYSGYTVTGKNTQMRVKVDYNYPRTTATATLLYTRTNTYSGPTGTDSCTFTFGGASASSSGVRFYGQKTDATVVSVSFTVNLAGGTYSGSCTSPYSPNYFAFSGSVTLPAHTYTISYSANGGSGAPSAQTKTHGKNLTLSSTKPTRTGYTFKGWSTSSTATSATYNAGSTFTANTSVTLYAVWQANTYYVTYDANGGTGAPAQQAFTFNSGAKISTTTPIKPGHSFSHWLSNPNSTSFTPGATIPDGWGSFTLVAQWTPNKYYLDLNAYLDGTAQGNTSPMGTADVYVNGSLVANDTTDYYTQHNYGSTYEIKDIKTNIGYTYTGSSSYSGTITQNTGVGPTWTTNSYNLTINPNGGVWNGSSLTQTASQKYNTTKTIADPTRIGYKFLGWTEQGYGRFLNSSGGDGSFDAGVNNVSAYNNSGGGTVTITRQVAQSDNPIGGSYELAITSTTGTTSPGLGGFVQYQQTAANKVYRHIFIAKIPSGYSIWNARNAAGDGATDKWLTGNWGTGKWEVYAYETTCGSSGSFSTMGHVYIVSGSKPLTWYLAYSEVFDMTASDKSFKFREGATTITAQWEPLPYTITFDANYGENDTTTKEIYYSNTYTDLPIPTRDGYSFKGWYINFDGIDDFLNYGREYMYTDKISIHLKAYMDNWTEFATKSMRLISCTESGGWNIEPTSTDASIGYIQYAMNKGGTYVVATSNKTWASLESGWHTFDLIHDGTYTKGYLDGELIATSTSNANSIYYNATNSIFLGAEPGPSSTTPVEGYFKGKIGSISIQNNTTLLSTEEYNTFTAPASNITLIAEWEKNTSIITYNQNGNIVSNMPETQEKEFGVNLTLSSLVPVRTRYNFLGWSTDPNASRGSIGAGGTFTLDQDTILYAIWELIDKTIWIYRAGLVDAVDFITDTIWMENFADTYTITHYGVPSAQLSTPPISLSTDNSLKVIFDNVLYNDLSLHSFTYGGETVWYAGNPYVARAIYGELYNSTDTGEPFCIVFNGSQYWLHQNASSTGVEHTTSIYVSNTNPEKMFKSDGKVYASEFITHDEAAVYLCNDGKIYAKEFIKY